MKAPVVEVTLCGAESLFTTLTFVPGFTVSGAPNLKFLIVIVALEVAALFEGDEDADAFDEADGEGELDDEPEPDEEQAAAIVRTNPAIPMRRSALISERYGAEPLPVQLNRRSSACVLAGEGG